MFNLLRLYRVSSKLQVLWRMLFFCLIIFVYSTCFSQEISYSGKSSPANSFRGSDTSDREEIPEYFIVEKIIIRGNKTTRHNIITRELDFQEGDTIQRSRLNSLIEHTKEKIQNTLLFNFVDINTSRSGGEQLLVEINVSERWYTWPMPIFELADRNFNQWWLTKDPSRTNYGFFIYRNNFRGRNETFAILFKHGYTRRYGLSYAVPYIDRKKTIGLSVSFGYSLNKEIGVRTVNNKIEFFKNPDDFVRKEFNIGAGISYRKGYYETHSFKTEYRSNEISDTVAGINNDYYLNNGIRERYLGLNYKFAYDRRDYVAYPLTGHLFEFEATKKGLGIFTYDVNVLYLTAKYNHYLKILPKFYFAYSVKGKLSGVDKQPYSIERGLGYGRDYVRTYEYYVIDGQHFALFRSNFKYQLIGNKVTTLSALPMEKFNTIPFSFYLNIFADAGYVKDRYYFEGNPLTNSFLTGVGAGIDFVSYYNIVFRAEYGINHLKERGLFLHFLMPI